MEHIVEPYRDVPVLTTKINSRSTDQMPIINADVVHDTCKQTEIETEERNDKLTRENTLLRMKFIEIDNKFSSLTGIDEIKSRI